MGAEKFRSLQDEGKTSWPAPTFRLDHATYINIPSRENGREINCRLVQPQNLKAEGVFLYSHGGGHVLGHCDWYVQLSLTHGVMKLIISQV
jgi:acetyl esterase/lipase